MTSESLRSGEAGPVKAQFNLLWCFIVQCLKSVKIQSNYKNDKHTQTLRGTFIKLSETSGFM